MFKKNNEDEKNPIRQALKEILEQAEKYQFSPLEEKMKSKMKPAVEEPIDEESSDEEEASETPKEEADEELELTPEQKKKLLELLG